MKDNKIDLLVQQYQQFTILEEESIDSGFARFNTIITSLKALDEGFSSKNYVRKFLRDLHPKWRAKVTVIEESKDLSLLALDELIGSFEKSVDLLGNHKKKRSHSGKGMIRKERVIGNALDTMILIISLANVQSINETRTKRHSSEVLGAIAKMKPRTKLTMKLVSWLNRQMRYVVPTGRVVVPTGRYVVPAGKNSDKSCVAKAYGRKEMLFCDKFCDDFVTLLRRQKVVVVTKKAAGLKQQILFGLKPSDVMMLLKDVYVGVNDGCVCVYMVGSASHMAGVNYLSRWDDLTNLHISIIVDLYLLEEH
ncbi:hypothetical protein Tco_0459197 [Tanacetum coccineum]